MKRFLLFGKFAPTCARNGITASAAFVYRQYHKLERMVLSSISSTVSERSIGSVKAFRIYCGISGNYTPAQAWRGM